MRLEVWSVLKCEGMREHHIPANQQLLSRHQLSDRWSCSIETIKRRERAGVISAMKLGGLVRYSLQDILKVEAAATVRGGLK